jgi:dihydroorotate dehydrogenase
LSLKFIKKFYKLNKGKVPLIGVGGVDSGQSAFEKIAAGATAIQLYTGMVYKGPGIIKDIKRELIEILKNKKIKNIQEAVGINS